MNSSRVWKGENLQHQRVDFGNRSRLKQVRGLAETPACQGTATDAMQPDANAMLILSAASGKSSHSNQEAPEHRF
jgi:hypothetical protein